MSLPQLAGDLAGHPNLAGGRFANEVQRRLKEWKDGRIYHAADDPARDELIEFAESPDELRLVEGHTHHGAALRRRR